MMSSPMSKTRSYVLPARAGAVSRCNSRCCAPAICRQPSSFRDCSRRRGWPPRPGCVEAPLGGEAARALAFSSVAKHLTETLQAIGDPGGDLQHEIKTLMLGTSTDTVPHVSELGGSHTTDLLGEPTTR